jgi:hypothetical protein
VAAPESTPPSPPVAEAAAPAPPALEPALSAWLQSERDTLGRACERLAVVSSGEQRYLACGAAGLWVVRVAGKSRPKLIGRHDLQGSVTGLFVREGKLWAEVSTTEARPLLALTDPSAVAMTLPPAAARPASPSPPPPVLAQLEAPAAAAPAAAPPSEPAPAPVTAAPRAEGPSAASGLQPTARSEGKVIAVEPGAVVIDLGIQDFVREGANVALYALSSESLGPERTSVRRELLAVGRAERVTADRTRVRLGLDERAPLGSMARLSGAELTAASLAPPRLPDLWHVGFLARPFLVLDNLGAGIWGDVSVGYRDENLHYEALLQPVTVASAEQGATFPAAAFLTVGYDSRLFEIGLGIGGQTVNDAAFDLEPGTGLSMVQRARFGALDGLQLTVFSHVALFHSEFQFSHARVTGQIPMSGHTWLIASGGGGSLGLGFGELGVRVLLSGNGDRDSFFLTATAGGVGVFESDGIDETGDLDDGLDYGGPMVGIGGEWRL